jgi:hypothetical protein
MESVKRTKDWLEKIVIDLGLCPFAAKVFYEKKILFVTTQFNTIQKSFDVITNSADSILSIDNNFSTSLIIFETGLESFNDYLDLYYTLEDHISHSYLESHIQLASFHPRYQFDGTDVSDLGNYTNRSPYPIIHLLRTDDVTEAIKSYPNITEIPNQNIAKMTKLGYEGLKILFGDM